MSGSEEADNTVDGASEELPWGWVHCHGKGTAGEGARSEEGNRVRRAESLRMTYRLQLHQGCPVKETHDGVGSTVVVCPRVSFIVFYFSALGSDV